MDAHLSFGRKLVMARKAVIGLFSDRVATEAHGLLAGIYPSAQGPLPVRGSAQLLDGYSTMPWLRAVANKVGSTVAATQWQLFKPINTGHRDRKLQRTFNVSRHALISRAVHEERLIPIESHILLDALADANSFLVGHSLFLLTQVYLDLVGEAFWIKERNGLGAPVGFWPVPPNWVKGTPTVSHPFFTVSWKGWQGKIPDTEVVWFVDPNPSNPYGRGSGLAMALVDELEADEYAARHQKMVFLNRARPDLIIWPEETKHDSGTISDANARRLAEKWRAEHGGFWNAALPYFATRKLGVKELQQSFEELQLKDLRAFERDTIISVWGVPPEELGVITNSNRATIESADFLYKKNVIVPRLELLRAFLQERLLPEYDERIVIDYVNPVGSDREAEMKAATLAPWSLKVDEHRALSGHEPLPDKAGQVYMVPLNLQPRETLQYPPPLTTPTGTPTIGPTPDTQTRTEEWAEALEVCKAADDLDGQRTILKAIAEDPDDLPELSRRWARKEPAMRRQIAESLVDLRDQTDLDAIERALGLAADAQERAVLAAVPITSWAETLGADLEPLLAEAFLIGAKVGGEAAGLQTRAPDPVFNVVNSEAVRWAKAHAGELITGTLTQGALDGIRAAIVKGLEQGWSARKLARIIRETVGLTARQSQAVVAFAEKLQGADIELADPAFWKRVTRYAKSQQKLRALMIARTELAFAASEGQQRLWDAAIQNGSLRKGAMRKKWLQTLDDFADVCDGLAAEDPIEIDAVFSNGLKGPPAHPNCRCATGLVTAGTTAAAIVEVPQAVDVLKAAVRDGFAGLTAALTPPPINITIPEREVHVDVHMPRPTKRRLMRGEDGRASEVIIEYGDTEPGGDE